MQKHCVLICEFDLVIFSIIKFGLGFTCILLCSFPLQNVCVLCKEHLKPSVTKFVNSCDVVKNNPNILLYYCTSHLISRTHIEVLTKTSLFICMLHMKVIKSQTPKCPLCCRVLVIKDKADITQVLFYCLYTINRNGTSHPVKDKINQEGI